MKRKGLSSLSHLQDYGSSESEEESTAEKPCGRLPLPNLPTYQECKSIKREPQSENSSKKIRNFPHEPGNWATYIYASVRVTSELDDFVQSLLSSLLPMELDVAENFHISLTRTVVLRHHWIKDFTESVNEVLVDMKPFFINLTGFKVYVNENKTRTFIGLKVQEGSKELTEIVEMLDKCLASYNLPPFYKPPSFHMSVLWCVGDKLNKLSETLNNLPRAIQEFNVYEKVHSLKCNSGNKYFTFNFNG